MLFALAAGIWRAADGFGPGTGEEGPQQPAIAFGQIATPDDGSIDPADLPTAGDCTVEPLSVHEVVVMVDKRYMPFNGWNGGGTIADEAGSLIASGTEIQHPDGETLADVREVWYQWVACYLADSIFQLWALESPRLVQKQLLQHFDPLTGREEATAFLESIRDGERPMSVSRLIGGISLEEFIPDISSNPKDSVLYYGAYFISGAAPCDLESGELGKMTTADLTTAYAERTDGPRSTASYAPAFGLSADGTTWLVDIAEFGMG